MTEMPMHERMRILHVIEAPLWTGAMARTLNEVTGLRRLGHEVVLACTPGSVLWKRAERAGVELFGVSLQAEVNPVAAGMLAALILRRRIQIVHSHRAHAHAVGLLASAMTGRPFIVGRHTALPPKDNLGSRVKYLSRKVTRYVAISRAVADVLIGYGVPEEKVAVIFTGVDTERFGPHVDGAGVRQEFGVSPDAPLIGKISNLYGTSKGHDVFLEAARAVAEAVPDALFLLAGNATDSGKLEKMAGDLGIGNRVILAGHRDDVPEIMAALDVLVNCPRSREGLSLVLLEGMAAGRAVVGTRVGGIPEIVRDGETGLLVAPGDPGALASALLRLLHDPQLASGLAAGGARYVRENLTIDQMVERTERLYTELLTDP